MNRAVTVTVCGAAGALLAVAAGAFGAHGLRDRVGARELEIWQTGAHYQQVHAVVLLAVALWAAQAHAAGQPTQLHGVAMALFAAGVLIFSGTLYAMTLGGPRVLGAITPLGGLCLLGAWAIVALIGLRSVS